MPTRADLIDQTARIKAAIVAAFFERWEDLYQHTRNPLHVWHAYVIARQADVSLPSWVLGYLDQVAGALTAPEGPRSPQAIAEAVGLATKGGPSKARQAQTDERDFDIVGRVWDLRRLVKTSPNLAPELSGTLDILQRVADEFGLSLERVQAIYYRLTRLSPWSGASPASSVYGSMIPTQNRQPAKRRPQRAKRARRTNS